MKVYNDQIGSAEAAKILGVSIRRVQALKEELEVVEVLGRLVFSRAKVEAFKKLPRTSGWKKGVPRAPKDKPAPKRK